jgi:hypothetical protein
MKRLSILAFAVFLLNHCFAQQQPTCNPYPKTISVTGTAEMEIVPDEIYVQVDLREYKKRAKNKWKLKPSKQIFSTAAKRWVLPIHSSALHLMKV